MPWDREVLVKRNDELSLEEIARLAPRHLVISPGPARRTRRVSPLAAIRRFAGEIPILGVCLGHQSLAQAFGAQVVRARQMMHGKTSLIRHRGGGVQGIEGSAAGHPPPPLVVERDYLPDCFEITAWSEHDDGSVGEIMGLRRKTLALEGVQFHPESILSEQGHQLLANF